MKKFSGILGILLTASLWAQAPAPTPAPVVAPAPAAAPAPAPTPVDIEFILDASGSMRALWGQESQIVVAKKAIKDTLATIPAGTSVAFRVYANRVPQSNKAGSCQDTQLLIPFQPLNPAIFGAAVDTITPLGWTPIAYSLRQVPNDFLGKEAQHYIILVSDGEETCGGDPVAEAKNLLAQGFKVIINTIGIRVDAKTRAELAAISSATGGQYFDAKDAGSLVTNLQAATKKAFVVDKPAEAVRGQEIHGGDQFTSAVALPPNVEYRLDHHLKKNQYDYFYVDLKKGQQVKVTISTMDHGIYIDSQNKAMENTDPYAGFRIMGPSFEKITSNLVIGERHGMRETSMTADADKRYYILLGNEYEGQHKDSPFKMEIATHADAGSGQDAGEDLMHALPVEAKEYPENWMASEHDNDFYQIQAKSGETYSIVATPKTMKLGINVNVFNRDRIKMDSKGSGNQGAIVRLENISPKYDGPFYVGISTWGIDQPEQYSLSIQASAGPAVAETNPAPSAPAVTTPSTPPPPVMQTPTAAPTTNAKGKNWMLYGIVGIAVLIGLLILVIILILKPRRKL